MSASPTASPFRCRRARRAIQLASAHDKLLLGIRPEHITEAKAIPSRHRNFDAVLDVTEPMGMETLIYFTLEGAQSAAGSIPTPARRMAARSDWQWTSTICTC